MNEILLLLKALNASPFILLIVGGTFLAIVGVWAYLVRTINKRDGASEARSQLHPDGITNSRASQLFLYFTVGLSALIVFVIFAAFSQGTPAGRAFVTVAALILLGIAAFIGIMSLLSRTAKKLGIIDQRHPFGLPEGSVRAILTIAFIVLVGVLSAFLITNHNSRSPFVEAGQVIGSGLSEERANDLAAEQRDQFGDAALVAIVARAQPAGEGTPPQTAYDVVVHPRADNSMGDDIAKQTLTMISTILAAMIGFYFAERTGSGGGDPAELARMRAAAAQRLTAAKARLAEVEVAVLRLLADASPAVSDEQKARRAAARRVADVILPQRMKQAVEAETRLSDLTIKADRLEAVLIELNALASLTADALIEAEAKPPQPKADAAAKPADAKAQDPGKTGPQ